MIWHFVEPLSVDGNLNRAANLPSLLNIIHHIIPKIGEHDNNQLEVQHDGASPLYSVHVDLVGAMEWPDRHPDLKRYD